MFKKRAEDERENGDRLIRACLGEVEHSEAQTSWDHDTETLNVGYDNELNAVQVCSRSGCKHVQTFLSCNF